MNTMKPVLTEPPWDYATIFFGSK